ncbi:ATP synthase delta/epsilon chain alpha-helix domain-containing protein, partial [Ralstonia solanacearum]|uniref:ATP synthase delta/epsilon chain alpha-helix domain-containing protein n=1 Tax=Ralstonia solanacearum TaxID=305 RepID=UPI002E2439AD
GVSPPPLPQEVILLADTAVRARDLDEAKAQQARKAAEELLQNSRSKIDYARAQAELAEAVAQLAAIERLRRRRR